MHATVFRKKVWFLPGSLQAVPTSGVSVEGVQTKDETFFLRTQAENEVVRSFLFNGINSVLIFRIG
jgi:hypothetical protein